MKKLFAIIFLLFILTSCGRGGNLMEFNEKYPTSCDEAMPWTELFDRAGQSGWLGADGIYSVALDGNDSPAGADGDTKTLFIFSDTRLGTSAKSGDYLDTFWANHTAAVLEGNEADPEKITFYYGYKGSGDRENSNLFGEKQWLFDMFVLGGNVYIFAFSQENWKPAQIDIIQVPVSADGYPVFEEFSRVENVTSLLKRTEDFDYAYGMGILNNTTEAGAENPDEYVYLYGYRDNLKNMSIKDMIVSRIHKDHVNDFSKLRYWNGTEWCENIEDSAIILENVSCEVSVSLLKDGPHAGKYIAVYTEQVESDRIMYAIGDTPVGPFSEPVQIYTVPEYRKKSVAQDGLYYTYNAKAHPHLSPEGTLLVSYNVNVRGTDATNTYDYRPRFISIDWD